MIHNPTDRLIFPELDPELLERVRKFGETLCYLKSAWLMQEGDSPYDLFVIHKGEVRASRKIAGVDTTLVVHKAGEFTGDVALLYTTTSNISLQAMTPCEVTCVPAERIRDWLAQEFAASRVIVMTMTNRFVDAQLQIRHREKMAALSTLAAGLAHELGNPLAVIMRSHSTLGESLNKFCKHIEASESMPRSACNELMRVLAAAPDEDPGRRGDAFAGMDLEDEFYEWLDGLGVEDASQIAPVFAGAGLDLTTLRSMFPDDSRDDCMNKTLTTMNAILAAQSAISRTAESGERMQRVVSAIKSYTDMDRAPWREVDLHEGLTATLEICRPRLSKAVTVSKQFDLGIPRVTARPAELNQVWTNLIENAGQAMGTSGQLEVVTSRDGDSAVVEFLDSGSGIPPDALGRIFEPFFTTRDVGQGLGLGLHTAHTIVVGHHNGAIHVDSRPGRTSFRVHLPLHSTRHSYVSGYEGME